MRGAPWLCGAWGAASSSRSPGCRSVGQPLLGGCPVLQGCPNRSSGQTGTAGIVCLGKCLAAFSSLERNPAEWVLPQLGQRDVGHVLAKGITDRVASDCQVQRHQSALGLAAAPSPYSLVVSVVSAAGESLLSQIPWVSLLRGSRGLFLCLGKGTRRSSSYIERWRRLCLRTLKCY